MWYWSVGTLFWQLSTEHTSQKKVLVRSDGGTVTLVAKFLWWIDNQIFLALGPGSRFREWRTAISHLFSSQNCTKSLTWQEDLAPHVSRLLANF